VVANT